ncbi:MAG TPA: adenylate/guanylate cyclase domain-containing protein [Nocardioidaceae bacterium]|nr:adenylate/guanylate cyclase domain-containing protein [Nocardioidaceae bacterium]
MTANPATRYTAGDDRVAYQVLGDGPIDLVCTHGQWGQLDLEWEDPASARFLRRLASFSRLIRFNARGTGLSDARPRDGHEAWEYWVEDLLAVMEATRSETAAIVGFIDSGALALQFAAAYPERVSALVLMNTGARFTEAPGYPEGWPPAAVEQFLGFAGKYWGSDTWTRAANPSLEGDHRALARASKFFRATGSPKSSAENFAYQMRMDARPVLPGIRAPTLVMSRRDYKWVLPAQARYVSDHIEGARYIELPGADASPYWEAPDLILDHIEQFVTGHRHGVEQDRILTTVLFTDIVGSTSQAARLGDAAWRALLDMHDTTLREQVGLFGGNVADHSGDGSLSTFEAPRQAIECARALHRALADLSLEIRAGIHFGEVERRTDGGVGGVNVHVGARVMALAAPGEVLVSHTVQGILAGSLYSFEERGRRELKGVPGRWPIFAVLASDQL